MTLVCTLNNSSGMAAGCSDLLLLVKVALWAVGSSEHL